MRVVPLYAQMSTEAQSRAFEVCDDSRTVIVATNVAETALTLPNVRYVVDCGRMKEKRFDAAKRMESLEDCLISRANAKQRRGRAGRVRPEDSTSGMGSGLMLCTQLLTTTPSPLPRCARESPFI